MVARTSDNNKPKPELDDPVEWAGYFWGQNGFPDGERFLAMASILRTHQLITGRMERTLKPFGLATNAYLLLLTIQLSDSGARLLSHLAARIMVHPTTITLLADRLERDGLLRREPHPTDRRATFAKITPAGSALVREATLALDSMDFGLSSLTKTTSKDLMNILQKVRQDLGDKDHLV